MLLLHMLYYAICLYYTPFSTHIDTYTIYTPLSYESPTLQHPTLFNSRVIRRPEGSRGM